MDVRFDVIFVGNDAVSRETAATLSEGLSPLPRITELPALGPEGNVDTALQELSRTAGDMRVAAIGCEPVVGVLAARLIGARHPLVFKKAAACRIDLDSGNACGRLRWFLPPRILREIGRFN